MALRLGGPQLSHSSLSLITYAFHSSLSLPLIPFTFTHPFPFPFPSLRHQIDFEQGDAAGVADATQDDGVGAFGQGGQQHGIRRLGG